MFKRTENNNTAMFRLAVFDCPTFGEELRILSPGEALEKGWNVWAEAQTRDGAEAAWEDWF